MLSGDNSILQKATDAKENTDRTSVQERVKLAYLAALTGKNGSLTEDSFKQELIKEFGASKITDDTIVTSEDGKTWTVTIDGATTEVEAVAILPKDTGTKPYLPSSAFHQLPGTNLSNGLVITDAEDPTSTTNLGNEYVWIEVPNDGTGPVYTAVASEEEDSENYYTAIATALRTYCTKDASGENLITVTDETEPTDQDYKTTTVGCIDTWHSGCGIADSGSYTTLYNKMLKSVYTNGGFWIGRYEAGTTTARNSGDSTSGIVPLSKIDLYPINWVTCSEAQTIAGSAQNIDRTKYTSSLMFGIQWDLVLRHLSNKGVSTSLLTEDSSTWGNYYDHTFEIKRGKYSHGYPWNVYIDYTTATANIVRVENNVSTKIKWSDYILLTTGAADVNSQKNIYDLAGNVYEWTLEKSFGSYGPCVARGGRFDYNGYINPASFRGPGTDGSYSYGARRF